MSEVTDPRVEAAFHAAWNEPCLLGDPIACHALEDAIPNEGETQTDAMKAVIRRMVEAALKAADVAAWQPIESAPKDGTVINVLLPRDISDSDREFYCYPQSRVSFGWAWKNGKFRPFSGLSIPVFIEPTHWMPLPMPPEPHP